jgi:hypothetical protein
MIVVATQYSEPSVARLQISPLQVRPLRIVLYMSAKIQKVSSTWPFRRLLLPACGNAAGSSGPRPVSAPDGLPV